jgi:acetate kinase
MNILTLNAGSNSLKFEIIATQPSATEPENQLRFGSSLIAGACDDIGKEHSAFSLRKNKHKLRREEVQIRDHGRATELLFDWIEQAGAREHGIHNLADIERIGHRIVHGADLFSGPARITDELIRQIEGLEDLAPLHNVSALKVIRAVQARIRDRLPMIAVFDTVFHRTIPEQAALYPLPPDLAQKNKIRRYGFHGISHRYMMIRYAQITQRPVNEFNLITLHLEGGSSATAIQRGKSIDTSMGFTPLEGLMMGTRCGDIDPAIVTYLMRKENMDVARVETFLNKECGLLGVSGVSADTRQLREHLSDERVNLAINLFCYRVRKYIGAYLSVLGGAEAIVAGGGISENTPVIRERIFENFDWCGAVLDHQRNCDTVDHEGAITTPESSVQIWVIPTQEGLMMARDVADYTGADHK